MLTCTRAYDMSHFENYYVLKSDPNSIKWSGFESAPNYNLLKEHYKKLISSNKVVLFFSISEKIVGYSQISFHNNIAEVDGYSVLSDYCGKGFGTQILKATINYLYDNFRSIKKIIAWVSEQNIPSLKCFINNSFIVVENQYQYKELKAIHRTDRFIMLSHQ